MQLLLMAEGVAERLLEFKTEGERDAFAGGFAWGGGCYGAGACFGLLVPEETNEEWLRAETWTDDEIDYVKRSLAELEAEAYPK